ncbi:MAG: TRAP transporter small permease subunit [Hyphomicrobiaceae bacterium]|nr:TRAP transporter small permease subunit [Hyphomicrobiaceae bacterium]
MQKLNVADGTAAYDSHRKKPLALAASDRLRRFVDLVGKLGSWCILPLVLITVIDVVSRKLVWVNAEGKTQGVQLWLVENFGRIFGSTLLQEMEWHFHTALFALVLGFGTIYNTHVRVGLIRDRLQFRKKIWLEFLGLSLFMIPYLAILIWFAISYTHQSYIIGEISASTVGLTHRWLIKSVLVFGLIVAAVAGIAVWLQVVLLLWGDRSLRFPLMTLEWPEEAGSRIEGKERITIDDAAADPASSPGSPKPAG